MSVNVLPDMDEPRLKALGKQLNRNRKSSLISTGKDKQNLDVYVKSLNKEKRSLDGKYSIRGMRLKKSLANVRGTQKVLKSKREQSFWEDSDEYPYGVYEGESIDSYRRQIEHVIEDKHPRLRRMRKVENHLKTGRSTGKILGNDEARRQFNEIMKHGRRKGYLNRENPLTKTFLQHTSQYARSGTMDHLWKNPTAKHKLRLKPNYEYDGSEDEENPTPIELKLNDGKKPKGMQRLYSPKTSPDGELGDTHIEHKWKRRLAGMSKSPISNDSPYTEVSTDWEEEEFKDFATVRSSPSKLNLPPISVSKAAVKLAQNDRESNKHSVANFSIRRVTKGDLGQALSVENLKQFEKLKTRRATTFL